jgi:hypothetical protein
MKSEIYLVIFLAIILILCVISIRFLLYKFQKIITKKSIGYIKAASIFNVKYFPIKFSVKVSLSGIELSEIIIKNIKVEITGLRSLRFILPSKFFVNKSNIIKEIIFDNNPKFIVNFEKSKNLTLSSPLKTIIIGTNNNNLVHGSLEIDKIIIKNAVTSDNKSDIEAEYKFEGFDNSHYKIHINLSTEHGISEKTKTKYLKSLKINNLNLKLKNSSVKASGNISYKFMDKPTGKIKIKINSADYLVSDLFNKEKNYIAKSINTFLEFIKQENDEKYTEIDFLFNKNGVFINSIPLQEIREKLHT